MRVVEVDSPDDPRLADYVGLTDVALRRRLEPEHGLFLAEGEKVVRRAVAAGYAVRSVLLGRKWLPGLTDLLEATGATAYVADDALLERLTGFAVHRGALASVQRKPLPRVEDLLRTARRVAVCEDVVSTTNLGAVFRGAAALGMDAVLLTPRCADPLYRRAVKVGMGAVFSVPHARFEAWPDGIDLLRDAGLPVLALTPAEGSVALDAVPPHVRERCALLLGTEGEGLSAEAIARADLAVRIPMAPGVDSLNVAAAAAVAFYALGERGGRA
ncbi:RNA methyltransferase [Vallicoccus soli]|uniref:RNA methyltransferase n=1 Tax=Vallicoccus soli TaxID=2339232 RepID=A0A3A3Z0K8_9ACTN|nr:RNA methyltransferase [Vallicoccus soli]